MFNRYKKDFEANIRADLDQLLRSHLDKHFALFRLHMCKELKSISYDLVTDLLSKGFDKKKVDE